MTTLYKAAWKILPLCMIALACHPEPKEEDNGNGKEPETVNVEKVVVNPTDLTLEMEQKATLDVDVLPENASDKTVTFFSSKPSIAGVDDKGEISALMLGKADIYVTAGDITAVCKVNVVAKAVRALEVSLSKDIVRLMPEESARLSFVTRPERIDELGEWVSSDESVATVDAQGTITAVATGEATVSLVFENCQADCKVVVKPLMGLNRVDPLEKIIPGKEYLDNPDTIRVARGETATVQMNIEAATALKDIKAELVRFEAGIEPKMYWERNITCTEHWDAWAGGRPTNQLESKTNVYPDPLMPMDEWSFELGRGEQNGLWAEFDIPRDFTPGLYEGEMKVTARGGLEAVRKFYVQVYPATLPEEQGLTVIQWDGGTYRAMRGGADDEYYAWNEYERVLVRFMNDWCQNAWRLTYATKSNMGGKCKADYTTDPPSIVYNFDNMWKREFELFIEECPGLRQIHGHQIGIRQDEYPGHFVLGGYYLNYEKLDELGRPTLDFYYGYDDDEQALAVTTEYFRQLRNFLASNTTPDGRTWLDLYVQTIYDEPKDNLADAYTRVAKAIKAGAPDMKITDAIETNKIDPKYLDYPCPTLSGIDTTRAVAGQTQWLYTCMSPQGDYANRFIRLPLIKTRIIHWCNYYYDAPAYLHWGLKYWDGVDDPFGDAYGSYIGGDQFIIYPGYYKLYPSIRLCAMRDGIRDYDLLRMVEEKDKALADDFCHRLVQGPAQYDLDLTDFRQLRRDILDYLSR